PVRLPRLNSPGRSAWPFHATAGNGMRMQPSTSTIIRNAIQTESQSSRTRGLAGTTTGMSTESRATVDSTLICRRILRRGQYGRATYLRSADDSALPAADDDASVVLPLGNPWRLAHVQNDERVSQAASVEVPSGRCVRSEGCRIGRG